jgi:hypothetical protein
LKNRQTLLATNREKKDKEKEMEEEIEKGGEPLSGDRGREEFGAK